MDGVSINVEFVAHNTKEISCMGMPTDLGQLASVELVPLCVVDFDL